MSHSCNASPQEQALFLQVLNVNSLYDLSFSELEKKIAKLIVTKCMVINMGDWLHSKNLWDFFAGSLFLIFFLSFYILVSQNSLTKHKNSYRKSHLLFMRISLFIQMSYLLGSKIDKCSALFMMPFLFQVIQYHANDTVQKYTIIISQLCIIFVLKHL